MLALVSLALRQRSPSSVQEDCTLSTYTDIVPTPEKLQVALDIYVAEDPLAQLKFDPYEDKNEDVENEYPGSKKPRSGDNASTSSERQPLAELAIYPPQNTASAHHCVLFTYSQREFDVPGGGDASSVPGGQGFCRRTIVINEHGEITIFKSVRLKFYQSRLEETSNITSQSRRCRGKPKHAWMNLKTGSLAKRVHK